MRTRDFDYIIVGGGLAAASAVDGIRELDKRGTIVLLTDETEPPYHRPPLSKEYLQTADAPRSLLHVKPEGWFESEAGVTLLLETSIVSLDPRSMTVAAASGEVFRGRRILLATGGRPRTLSVPGGNLEGVYSLRTVEDAEAIRTAAQHASRAVLVGAGFIGMELAASLVKLGIDPVVVELEDRVWTRMLPPELSRFVADYFEARGVEFRLGPAVREFGGEGRLEYALLDDGERIGCELAVTGIGILPNVELARAAAMAVDDGILVDAYGETSHGYIYAAGDVARYPDALSGEPTRVEHWDHAKTHGRTVGRNMAGAEEPYDHLAYFFCHVFDLSLNVFGRPEAADRLLIAGELDSGRAIVYCGAGGRLVGAVLVNAADALDECRELVRRAPDLDELGSELEDPDAELSVLSFS